MDIKTDMDMDLDTEMDLDTDTDMETDMYTYMLKYSAFFALEIYLISLKIRIAISVTFMEAIHFENQRPLKNIKAINFENKDQ